MRLHHIALDTLAASPVLWIVGAAAPRLFAGGFLHRAALWAAWEGAFPEAERLFEAAARHYQNQLDLVPLARLRVHQAMAHARASTQEERDGERCLIVERRMCHLERIEAPWPPFLLVDAPSLLASWREDQPALPGVAGERLHGDGHALDSAA